MPLISNIFSTNKYHNSYKISGLGMLVFWSDFGSVQNTLVAPFLQVVLVEIELFENSFLRKVMIETNLKSKKTTIRSNASSWQQYSHGQVSKRFKEVKSFRETLVWEKIWVFVWLREFASFIRLTWRYKVECSLRVSLCLTRLKSVIIPNYKSV